MANEEQLAILRQGVEVWNEWRKENPNNDIDLSWAKLRNSDLGGANLSETKLTRIDLRSTVLTDVDFRNALLTGADLREATLRNTNFESATLRRVDFGYASLIGVNFMEASLISADFRRARISKTNFTQARMDNTAFGNNDLSNSIGLETVMHGGESLISASTLQLSKGMIPLEFLRGCGLSDWEIESAKLYDPSLTNQQIDDVQHKIHDLRATRQLQVFPLFISYSHANGTFVDKIGEQFNKKGIRFWRDIHELKAGKIEKQIDQAITQNRTVVLVLSEHSLSSDWVEHEVRTARQLEKDMERDVLCPVALDDSWKSSQWPKRIMEQIMEYNILDFSEWEDDVKFEGMFRKLIDGLELFYKG